MNIDLPEIYHCLPEDVRASVDLVLETLLSQEGLQGLVWGGSTIVEDSKQISDIDLWAFFEKPKIAKSSFLSEAKTIPQLMLAHDAGALRWFGYLATLFFSGKSKFSVDVGFTRLLDISEMNTGPGYQILWADVGVEMQLRSGIQKKSYVLTPESHGGEIYANLIKIRKSILAKDSWNAFECLARARRALLGLLRDLKKNQVVTYYERPERGLSYHLTDQEEQELALTISDLDLSNIRWAAIRIANLFLKYTKGRLSEEMALAIKELVNSLSPNMLWSSKSAPIGLVGVGRIGYELLRHIMQFYEDVYVVDIDPQCVNRAEELGAVSSDVNMISRKCGIVLLSLPNPEASESVLNEILKEHFPRKIIIDTSTNAVDRQVSAAERCRARGHAFVDAPLSGGPWGANEGTLTVMVGATDDDYRDVLPVLRTFGKNVVHVGPAGHGSMAKLIHNMVGEVQVQAFAEAFVVGSLAGVDLSSLNKCLSSGMVSSRILTKLYSKGILSSNESLNVTIDMAEKDQMLLLKFAKSIGVSLTFTEDVHDRLVKMQNDDIGKNDVSHTLKWFEGIHNVSIDIEKIDWD